MQPQIKNLDNVFSGLKSIEKVITKIIDTNVWINNKERKHLNQALKKYDVELVHKDKKAKGEISMNTFNNMYLIEYEKAKLIKLMERKLFSIPSIENKLKEFCSIAIMPCILLNKL